MSHALKDITEAINGWVGIAADLYWCPHCGFMITDRAPRNDLITACWGPCLEIYGEPIDLTFVRGIGRGAPGRQGVF